MSKIIKLEATNFKRLRAVDITPESHLNVIAGRNAQGKTSVLDAITAALGGSSTKATPRPIRDGESSAEIVLETEDLIVTRTFTAAGTKVVVKGRDGVTHGKGQAKLDGLLGRLSLDPLGFTQLTDRDQLKTLLDLVDLPFDLPKLEAERAKAFEQRTDTNRDLKQASAQVAGFAVFPADTPTEEVSVGDLLAEYRDAQAALTEYGDDVKDLAHATDDVERLRQELAEAEAHEVAMKASLNRWQVVDMPDLEAIQARIANVEQTNAQAREYAAYQRAQQRLAEISASAKLLTDQLAGIDKAKADGLKKAKFPVDGLGFDAEGITYNGVPFKQASGAEQLRVSLAMAIALNPALRVIRIADGSLLDNDSLDLVERMAIEHDYQVWIEMVSDTGDFGIVIEDGLVA
jgi:DNA repair exonuclease SbcCD ATPase subunit